MFLTVELPLTHENAPPITWRRQENSPSPNDDMQAIFKQFSRREESSRDISLVVPRIQAALDQSETPPPLRSIFFRSRAIKLAAASLIILSILFTAWANAHWGNFAQAEAFIKYTLQNGAVPACGDTEAAGSKWQGSNFSTHDITLEPNKPQAKTVSMMTDRPKVRPNHLDSRDTMAKNHRLHTANCHGSSQGNYKDCKFPALISADRDLGDAYTMAIHENISSSVLAPYSQRWSNLRDHANEDPVGTAEQYRTMAAEIRARSKPLGQN